MPVDRPIELQAPSEANGVSRSGAVSGPNSTRRMTGSVSRVLHVTSWLSRQGGGIPPVIWALARETNQRGHPCSVLGLKDEWMEMDCNGDQVPFSAGDVWGPKALGFSPDLNNQLSASVQPGTIIHSHGLWMHPGIAARKCCVRNGCPLLISPHGMLEPWALNRSPLKKKLAAWWFEDKNLREADCLHALCAAEAENFRRYGLKNPIAIIPNGVDLPKGGKHPVTHGNDETGKIESGDLPVVANDVAGKISQPGGRRCVLFLSRLHPKKGLINLLHAWRQIAGDFKDWCLLIGGHGDPDYEQGLKTLAKDYGLEKSVVFTGPLYGEDKRRALAGADVFVLPSFSEGFSMAILEAVAAGLPVLLTPECNFPELAKAGAAIEVSTQAPILEKGLRQILQISDEERKAMGRKGTELVRQSYTWPAIAERMCKLYEWLAGNTERPEDVQI